MGEPRHHADAGAVEPVLDRGKVLFMHRRGLQVSPLRGCRSRVPRIVDVTEGRAQASSEVVIEASQFFPPICRRRDRGDITIRQDLRALRVACIATDGGIGQRDQRIHQGNAVRVQHRNQATLGAQLVAGIRVVLVANACVRRSRAIGINLPVKRCGLSGQFKRTHIVEIPAALGQSGDGLIEVSSLAAGTNRRIFQAEFFRPEKKRLLVLWSERPAQCEAEILPAIKRGLAERVKIVARVKEFIAQEFIRPAVELRTARLGGDQNRAGGRAAVLRAVVRSQDFTS